MDFKLKEKGLSNTRVKKVKRVDIGRAENCSTTTPPRLLILTISEFVQMYVDHFCQDVTRPGLCLAVFQLRNWHN